MADETRNEQGDELEGDEPGPTPDEPTPEEVEGDEQEVGDDEPEAAALAPAAAEPQGPQPPQTEKEMEKRQKAWDAERDRHMEKAKAADDYRYAMSVICPFCEGHGLMYEPQTPEEQSQLRGFILQVAGEATPEELHDHPTYHRCETCEGFGKVRTGSRVAGQEALNCPDCNGQGHTGGARAPMPTPLPTAAAEPPPGVPPEEQARIGNDAWGRPPGHPHYGLLPAQVN